MIGINLLTCFHCFLAGFRESNCNINQSCCVGNIANINVLICLDNLHMNGTAMNQRTYIIQLMELNTWQLGEIFQPKTDIFFGSSTVAKLKADRNPI